MRTAGGVHPTQEKTKFGEELAERKIYSPFLILTGGEHRAKNRGILVGDIDPGGYRDMKKEGA